MKMTLHLAALNKKINVVEKIVLRTGSYVRNAIFQRRAAALSFHFTNITLNWKQG